MVSGAASGLGAAIARMLAREGASVVLADLNDAGGNAVRAEIEAQGGSPLPTPSTGPTPTPDPGGSPRPTPSPDGELPSDIGGLIEYANTHFDLAQAALRDGDFAVYGDEIAKVEAALQRLDALGGGLSPTP